VKRRYSLKGRDLFREIFTKGKRFKGKGIHLLLLPCPGVTQSAKNTEEEKSVFTTVNEIKIGITIQKRFGKAHDRNKAKRIIRALCSEMLEDMLRGFHIIIRPNDEFKNMKYEEQKNELRRLLHKAGIL